MKEIKMNVKDDSPFHFGQHLFVIGAHDRKDFRETCPVCDDANIVVIKGFECRCPYCRDGNIKNFITLYKPIVQEYIISKMTIEGETNKNFYKNSNELLPRIIYSGFYKHGKNIDSITYKTFSRHCINQRLPTEEEVSAYRFDCTCGNIFMNAREADLFIKEIHRIQKDRLMRFNAVHHTHYQYPFA